MIRKIEESEFKNVREAIQSIYFLPKCKWTKPLCDMAYDGLSCGKWSGYGYFGAYGELISYLDYQEHANGEIEIGICFTREEYEGRGLMTLMLRFLIDLYDDKTITIGTSEGNLHMRSCIKNVGFEEVYRIPADRVDGSASIHYRRTP